MDLSQFPITNGGTDTTFSDTTYVQQSPDFTGFNQPEDIIVGREPLLYISDTKNNRVVQMDIAGNQIGQLYFLNPRSLAQDRNFDLLVVADSVTSLNDTINIIYRIKLVESGGIITNASKIPLFASDYPTPISSRRRKFSGISTYNDNTILITRIGPDNISFIDPDNALIKIKGINSLQQYEILSGFQTTGNGIYSIDKTSSIKTISNSNPNFIFTRNTEDFGFKVQWFEYDNVNGTFDPKFSPETNSDIVRLQLGTPQDVTLDNNQNVFVIDSQRDSLYKFSNSGRLRSESFGGSGSGDNKFYNPKGVAWFNNVLYIADTGNNRIVRFKLSTDLN
ncbi:MAG: hypothetical protein IAE65_02515 [Ignavibacteria bacterium]|nr:hypothetical protein [Ignavibacteria bacterium]